MSVHPFAYTSAPPVVVSVAESAPTLGAAHTLTCSFSPQSGASLDIRWTNGSDGTPLSTGGGITVTGSTPYQLTFNQLTESNLGDYYCEVTVDGQSGCFIETIGKGWVVNATKGVGMEKQPSSLW